MKMLHVSLLCELRTVNINLADSQGAHKLLVYTIAAALSAEMILHDVERMASQTAAN